MSMPIRDGSAEAGATTPCATGFSDDFSAAPLNPCWMTLNGTAAMPLIDISIASGALHITARTGQDGVWFQGSTKSLVYKLLTGYYFKVTTTAHPRKRTDANVAPTNALHVGGIMARDPSSHGDNTENYLFTMVGSNESAQPGVEIKSTVNGQSVWQEPTWATPLAAELRMCRIKSDFYLYKRAPGAATWVLSNQMNQAAPVSRPDLPETLQVGLALNFRGPTNDLDVAFDDIVLGASPASVDDCTRD
jgi:hypothetical protein